MEANLTNTALTQISKDARLANDKLDSASRILIRIQKGKIRPIVSLTRLLIVIRW